MTQITKEAIEALAQEIRRVDGSNTLGAGALAEALIPFLSTLPIAVEGKVKALEWTPAAFHTLYGLIIRIAKTPFGVYKILKGTQNRYEVYFGDAPYSGSMDDEDQAKAWAQSDYETRILSALVSSPGKDGGQEEEAVGYTRPEYIDALRSGEVTAITGKPFPDCVPLYTRPQPASTALVERLTKALGEIAAYEPVKPSDNPLAWRFIQQARSALSSSSTSREPQC